MIQETGDQDLLSLPDSHMMDGALENISVIERQITHLCQISVTNANSNV